SVNRPERTPASTSPGSRIRPPRASWFAPAAFGRGATPSPRSPRRPGAGPPVRSGQSRRSLSGEGGAVRLVTVALRGDPASADTAVVPVQRTVAALASRSPGVGFLEAGDGSG